MGIWHRASNRKSTGGLVKRGRKTKNYESGCEPIKTVLGQRKVKKVKCRGGNMKVKLRSECEVNVVDQKAKSVKKVKVLEIMENKANPHFVRQKIITKGALLRTDLGVCRVMSRPGQCATVDAVLVEKAKVKKK